MRVGHRRSQIEERVEVEDVPGGSVAINESHVNLDVLRMHLHDELLVDFLRKPRYGQLDLLNKQSSTIKLTDLLNGRSLIYRHQREALLSDEILFYISSKNDANQRRNRLRLILPVTVIPQKDPLVQVNYYFYFHFFSF